jgi:hypothetical protein
MIYSIREQPHSVISLDESQLLRKHQEPMMCVVLYRSWTRQMSCNSLYTSRLNALKRVVLTYFSQFSD